MCVMGRTQMQLLGIREEDLAPANMAINTAEGSVAGNLGIVMLVISCQERVTHQCYYVLDGAASLFLSCDALVDSGCCQEEFRRVGGVKAVGDAPPRPRGLSAPQAGPGEEARPWKCPRRAMPPKPPAELPYPATVGNIRRLREWIVEAYGASAFNQCTHQPLPLMQKPPPLRLHVDPAAKPVACHRPGNLPAHLMESVKAELDRYVRTGVLRKVWVNGPVEWCSRMVVCAKKNGKARRMVDFKALNQAAPRQTHATEAPFILASQIPADSWKKCLDAWEGYHSVPIHPEDRKYTQFITPWGVMSTWWSPMGSSQGGTATLRGLMRLWPASLTTGNLLTTLPCGWTQLLDCSFRYATS